MQHKNTLFHKKGHKATAGSRRDKHTQATCLMSGQNRNHLKNMQNPTCTHAHTHTHEDTNLCVRAVLSMTVVADEHVGLGSAHLGQLVFSDGLFGQSLSDLL